MKETYLIQVFDEFKLKLTYNDDMKKCDEDVIKQFRRRKSKKLIVRRKWIEKNTFDWKETQQNAFDKVKFAISNNAMAEADSKLQYHLFIDVNHTTIKKCLFQFHDTKSRIEATFKLFSNERINFFMSFRLQDAETRYLNSKRKCFVIIKCLIEVRWMIMKSKYFILIYTDHETFKPIFVIEQMKKSRIIIWLDRFEEYDIQFRHRSSKDQHIDIADELSRMFIKFTSQSKILDFERTTMFVLQSFEIEI